VLLEKQKNQLRRLVAYAVDVPCTKSTLLRAALFALKENQLTSNSAWHNLSIFLFLFKIDLFKAIKEKVNYETASGFLPYNGCARLVYAVFVSSFDLFLLENLYSAKAKPNEPAPKVNNIKAEVMSNILFTCGFSIGALFRIIKDIPLTVHLGP
jgi:hypothetical protein